MTRPQTIQIFLPSGDPQGILVAGTARTLYRNYTEVQSKCQTVSRVQNDNTGA